MKCKTLQERHRKPKLSIRQNLDAYLEHAYKIKYNLPTLKFFYNLEKEKNECN